MAQKYDVTIVSAFGRGPWLASELRREGLSVFLLDMTNAFGPWPPEDQEGPFGFFRSESITESQKTRVLMEDVFQEQVKGFTVWLKDGPVEFKGPVSDYRLERILSRSGFASLWPFALSARWGQTVDHSQLADDVRPLREHFSIKKTTRNGLEQSLQWLREAQVDCDRQTHILDLAVSLGQRKISGFELKGECQGVVATDQCIWCLTSEESLFLSPSFKRVFKSQKSSEWCWLRYRVSVKQGYESSLWPMHFVAIEDESAPWTHENFLIVQRTALTEPFDVWIRLPQVQRFNSEYLKSYGAKIVQTLQKRQSPTEVTLLSLPQEASYTYSELGPARFPLFFESDKVPQSHFKNLYLDGPEQWLSYNWSDRFEHQTQIFHKVMSYWMSLQQKNNKHAEQESS